MQVKIKQEHEKLVRMAMEGCSDREIADACGYSERTVMNYLHVLDIGRRAQDGSKHSALTKLIWKHNFTQGELAEKLGCSRVALNFWCNGRHAPPAKAVGRMAEILGVDVTEILEALDG